jgi:hypothetical protein
MQNQTEVTLEPGANQLPQLYNPTIGARAGKARFLGSAEAHLGTKFDEPRDPNAATVVFDMEWPDAIRLAEEIFRVAKVVRALPPEEGPGQGGVH